MYSLTDIPTSEERKEALKLVPCHADLRHIAGGLRGVLKNQTIDIIDVAIGPDNHARTALVAFQEGVDTLLSASIDLVESKIVSQIMSREVIYDPLGEGEILPSEESTVRLTTRVASSNLEDAIIKCMSGLDHLANAHIRFAWEANCAAKDQLVMCNFDPGVPSPKWWTSASQLNDCIKDSRKNPLDVFGAFLLNKPFLNIWGQSEYHELKNFRDHLIHRAKPGYRERPAFGRTSVWNNPSASASIKITFPAPDTDPSLPSVEDYRIKTGRLLVASHKYVQEIWDFLIPWLKTLDIHIKRLKPSGIQITTNLQTAQPGAAFPRGKRDPVPFLHL